MSNAEEMINILQRENRRLKNDVEAWKNYVEKQRQWFLKYRDNLISMEAAMSKPNKPGYEYANTH